MGVGVKICGLSTAAAVEAAVRYGAAYAGFIFYPPSPRYVTAAKAAELAALVPENIKRVGVFVDPDDALLQSVLGAAPLDIIQLHGDETPARVAEIRARFGLQVMKAIKVSIESDVAEAFRYGAAADMLLFDARPPGGDAGALPGGNGIAFAALLVRDGGWQQPWMLSGGLNAETLGAAVAASGAGIVDVSSGVEDGPGEKNLDKIRDFLETAAGLGEGRENE